MIRLGDPYQPSAADALGEHLAHPFMPRRVVIGRQHERRNVDLTQPLGGRWVDRDLAALVHRELLQVVERDPPDPSSRLVIRP